jgi:hypothetical protein
MGWYVNIINDTEATVDGGTTLFRAIPVYFYLSMVTPDFMTYLTNAPAADNGRFKRPVIKINNKHNG